jgi:hypothetical protein
MINLQEEDWFIPGVKQTKVNLGESAKQIAVILDGQIVFFIGVKEEIAEKSDSLDTMDTSDLIDPLSPPSLKRIQSICVVSSSHGITDRWERGSSGSDTKKPKQKQKDPLGVPLANRFSI